MPKARFTIMIVLVVIAAAATIALAYFITGLGQPLAFAALGPILLAATIILHIRNSRK